ncbi:amino acid permease [Bacteriovorax stolpii]|uniref:Amino acid transporter n=1 Tax=Bacteriovorax stolpii TaxID=960 RepID=A0A2K9NPQ4_BACTC|nr:APC family permease [Bacteriovorax stolpii]AUN97489.1 amino acid transporter [Bacteriovorax stolpii]QDK42539.1 amino acid permease [Bacteriovorax stolpii]TDP52667.1 amino acid/polyamine/organocation transporter (APC superfamily) [Bacteriovorax stolpii]
MQSGSHLTKNLNVVSLSIFGIGIIIGAGVYAVLGTAAGVAGDSLWLSFLFAAAVAVLTAFSYCELASMYPFAGAEYIYLKRAFPKLKLPSFLLGFILFLAGAASAATVSHAFSGYLKNFLDTPETFTSYGLLIAVTLINLMGIHTSSRINLIFTAIEVAGLLAVIWFGFFHEPKRQMDFVFTAKTFTVSSLVFFVYLGFENIVNLAEDTKEAEKNVPRAIIWSLVITTILYVAVAVAALRLASPEVLSSSDSPLADAIKNVAPRWVNVLSAIALFSTANTALIGLLSISRMIYGIANEGDLPKLLTKTTRESKTPVYSILVSSFVAAIFLLLGELEILARVSSFAALCGFFIVNSLLIGIRYKKQAIKAKFKSPLSIGRFPSLAFIGALSVIALCTQFEFKIYLITFCMLALGALVYFLTKRFS